MREKTSGKKERLIGDKPHTGTCYTRRKKTRQRFQRPTKEYFMPSGGISLVKVCVCLPRDDACANNLFNLISIYSSY